MKNTYRLVFLICCLLVGGVLHAQATHPHARYLANEGVMVVNGDTKVLFDPLFTNGYGHYLVLSPAAKADLYAGRPPYDGIDAVFISHHHGDHFSPAEILKLLKSQSKIRLYAPEQAVNALRDVAGSGDLEVFERVTAVKLAYKDAPVTLQMESLKIEAVRIPHSGWPNSRLDIANISWRVTLNDETTVLHLGDADPNDVHFVDDAAYWDRNRPDMAFPPYWFFNSRFGPGVLSQRIKPRHSVGIHVPRDIPQDPLNRPADLRGADLFTQPGETRQISGPGVEASEK